MSYSKLMGLFGVLAVSVITHPDYGALGTVQSKTPAAQDSAFLVGDNGNSYKLLAAATAETLFDSGNSKYESGNYRGAINDYNEAIRLKPDYALA